MIVDDFHDKYVEKSLHFLQVFAYVIDARMPLRSVVSPGQAGGLCADERHVE